LTRIMEIVINYDKLRQQHLETVIDLVPASRNFFHKGAAAEIWLEFSFGTFLCDIHLQQRVDIPQVSIDNSLGSHLNPSHSTLRHVAQPYVACSPLLPGPYVAPLLSHARSLLHSALHSHMSLDPRSCCTSPASCSCPARPNQRSSRHLLS
jgi:hypothetical protein